MTAIAFHIRPAETAADIAAAVAMFRAYAATLPVDLGFQNFEAELAGMPGKYAPPKGALLLATDPDGAPLGCVALRPLDDDGCCEMKRLYLAPAARWLGLGRALTDAIVGEARRIGYREMRLDTLPSMETAVAIYRRMGFAPIAPNYDTPVEGTIFLALSLAD